MLLNQIALVSQTNRVTLPQLVLVSAALQKQVARDLKPVWEIDATVDAFERLQDVPLGYWPIVIKDNIPFNAQGIHLNKANGQPFALVKFSNNWSLTTSHECLEMLVDPSGNRIVAGNSVKPGQGRVDFLVEVCDPSEAAKFGYSVNGVLVSDFYTPDYFDPVVASGVRYSFVGAVKKPRQVLDGGYLSWFEPQTRHVFQLFVTGSNKQFVDLGEFADGFGSLRSFTDNGENTAKFRAKAITGTAPAGLLLTAALGAGGGRARGARVAATARLAIGTELEANAAVLQQQIDQLVAG